MNATECYCISGTQWCIFMHAAAQRGRQWALHFGLKKNHRKNMSISSRTGRCCFQQPNLLQSHTLKRPATEKLRNFGHLHGWNSLCKIERKTYRSYSKKHHKHLQAHLVELPKGLLFAPNRIHQTQIQLIQWALSSCIILYIDRTDRWIIATCPWGLGETGEA